MFKKLIRIFGFLLAAFIILSSGADVAGFVPQSNEFPPFFERVRTAAFSIALALPLKFKRSPYLVYVVFAVSAFGFCWHGWNFMKGALGYAMGENHLAIIPVGLLIMVPFALNSWTWRPRGT